MTVDWFASVIAEATPHLKPATVATRSGSRHRPNVRLCDVWTAPYDSRAWTFTEASTGPVDEVQVVRYRTGGFYARHSDNGQGTHRATTVVIQLSEPFTYRGGDLIIDGRTADRTRGAVITFPSRTPHETKPVRDGERWVIVAWVTQTHKRHPSGTPHPVRQPSPPT